MRQPVQEPHQRNIMPTGDKLKPGLSLTMRDVAKIQPAPDGSPAEGHRIEKGGKFRARYLSTSLAMVCSCMLLVPS